MKQLQTWLGAVLALQLVLAAGLYWLDHSGPTQNPTQPLLAFDPAAVDKLVIDDGQQSVTLTRTEGHWQLPGAAELPADPTKLQSALDKLQALQTGWPVATTAAAQQRFDVSPTQFQRHVTLYAGGQRVGEFYLGTSPGLRRTHLRPAGDEAIYSAAINSFDLPASSADWLDKDLLAAERIERIEGPDYALEKHAEQWRFSFNGVSDQAPPALNEAKAKQLAHALEDLRVQGPAESLPLPDHDGAATRITVSDGERRWRYTFFSQDDKYYVRRSDREAGFTLSKQTFDQITGIAMVQLAQQAENKGESADQPPGDGSKS